MRHAQWRTVAYDFWIKILALFKLQRVYILGLGIAAISLLFSACGGAAGSDTTTSAQSASINSLQVPVPQGPPPKKLVVKDLRKGGGTAIPPIARKPRVELAVLYTAVKYGADEPYKYQQNRHDPIEVEFGPGLNEGWEKGLVGMKEGGRRELRVPARMTVEGEPIVYVIELLAVKTPGLTRYARAVRQGLALPKKAIARLSPRLTIPQQSGPPPHSLEVIDLHKGSGAPIAKQDSFNIRYFSAPYAQVLAQSRNGLFGPQTFSPKEASKGMQAGLVGMKVGGRRELIVPPKLVFPRWKPSWGYPRFTNVYVVDLLRIIPPSG
jgi:peptidylprolyl isomerase